ncbi:MAG TPA: beta-N-acetylhexosaminidase [Candidatus Acidoferrales bacterium]|nr:beta-N-acetylhexosaminidase [Candidatus Acidoferrales bacterium]
MNMPPGPLVVGLSGPRLTAEEREVLMHPLIGAVILFERNYETPEQLRALIGALRTMRSDLLVTVDQEGGRVQRLRAGFTRLPPLGWLGGVHERSPAEALAAARTLGWLMAVELRAVDIDASFAPVLDVAGNTEIIGARAFHKDPAVVAALAKAYVAGMREAGMGATGKHFPGHGSVRGDSHLELPCDTRPLEAIRAHDLRPFAALAPALAAVMTAHVVYPAACNQPASFSRYWIDTVLRRELSFTGAVVSDDLEMAGAVVVGDVLARAEQALAAGCDLLPVCNDPAAVIRLLDGLRWTPPAGFAARHAGLRGRAVVPADPDRLARARALATQAMDHIEGAGHG